MTTLATIGDIHMLVDKKRGRGKISGGIVTVGAIVQRWTMIGFLVYRPDRDVIGIAIVTALTIVGDTGVKEGLCWLERIAGGMANHTVMGCR